MDVFAARCGLYCGDCEYRVEMLCPGCVEAGGSPFWGQCSVAACNAGRGLRHCGECDEFPCELLNSFAYDKQQGDDGQRIRNLEAWNDVGFAAWLNRHRAP